MGWGVPEVLEEVLMEVWRGKEKRLLKLRWEKGWRKRRRMKRKTILLLLVTSEMEKLMDGSGFLVCGGQGIIFRCFGGRGLCGGVCKVGWEVVEDEREEVVEGKEMNLVRGGCSNCNICLFCDSFYNQFLCFR